MVGLVAVCAFTVVNSYRLVVPCAILEASRSGLADVLARKLAWHAGFRRLALYLRRGRLGAYVFGPSWGARCYCRVIRGINASDQYPTVLIILLSCTASIP